MTLAPGTRLGAHEIIALIGASDIERLARFKREAQILASLNHPNIAGIYGLEETSSASALILELVEGPTLADRIAQDSSHPMALCLSRVKSPTKFRI